MSSFGLDFNRKWPWVGIHRCRLPAFEEERVMNEIVRMPSGELGIVDHIKPDGHLGVRPINPDGEFLPNESAHWTLEQRKAIPKEVALLPSELKPVEPKDVPKVFLTGEKLFPHVKNRLFR